MPFFDIKIFLKNQKYWPKCPNSEKGLKLLQSSKIAFFAETDLKRGEKSVKEEGEYFLILG